MTGQWLMHFAEPLSPAFEIVCFPWAGGGATSFHSFKPHLGRDVSLWAVTPPGRLQRLSEPKEVDFNRWVEAIGREICQLSNCPLVLFGHSFGAILAFEVAHWLGSNGHETAKLLCVSSRRAPGLPSQMPHLANAPDDDLISWMFRLGNAHGELLSSAEMLDVVLPPLRDDLTLDAAYRPRACNMLDIPILALAGCDDPLLDVAEMRGWKQWTTADFELRVLSGGHFHLNDHRECILKLIRRAVKGDIVRREEKRSELSSVPNVCLKPAECDAQEECP
jgi:pyochelin biosynthetic protein PchC